MFQIVKIVLIRAEGPTQECGKPRTVENAGDYVGFFNQADHVLASWGVTAPVGGGYDKCDVFVHFSDGSEWKARYDIHGDESPDLQKHLLRVWAMYAGVWCPAHMFKHKAALLNRDPEHTRICKWFWENCYIGQDRRTALGD